MIEIASLARWAIRTGMIAAGPWLAARGYGSEAMWTDGADIIAGATLAASGIAWSYMKLRQRKAAQAAL